MLIQHIIFTIGYISFFHCMKLKLFTNTNICSVFRMVRLVRATGI